ncbi:MAG: hypothetical protein K8R56_08370 [Candidatus Eisenbacteria bacterium]|nr:hypothetical protein [Candidatus Eisenbacteria bacterium]
MDDSLDIEATPYLARLQELPFVSRAWVAADGVRLTLQLRSGAGPRTTRRQLLITHRARLDRSIVVPLENIRATGGDPPLLMAPFVSAPMSEWLAEQRFEFIDLAGNCRITIGHDHFAMIQGRRPQTPVEPRRSIGSAGYQVLFALLADPATRTMPLRALAKRAGVSKSVAAVALKRFAESGLVTVTQHGVQLTRPQQAFHRWWMVQADQIAPRQLIGRFRTADPDPDRAEAKLEQLLSSEDKLRSTPEETSEQYAPRFAWGGVSAAWRLLRHYRGAQSVLHVLGADHDLPKRLGLLPSSSGNLTIYRHESSLALEGRSLHIAHPMLVYADLCMSNDERALEAAALWGKEFLHGFL